MTLTKEAVTVELSAFLPNSLSVFNRWLSRGDGIAIYENVEIGHPQSGHRMVLSFGGSAAQLETDDPPKRLPDIGNEINWRYQLVHTYRGETL